MILHILILYLFNFYSQAKEYLLNLNSNYSASENFLAGDILYIEFSPQNHSILDGFVFIAAKSTAGNSSPVILIGGNCPDLIARSTISQNCLMQYHNITIDLFDNKGFFGIFIQEDGNYDISVIYTPISYLSSGHAFNYSALGRSVSSFGVKYTFENPSILNLNLNTGEKESNDIKVYAQTRGYFGNQTLECYHNSDFSVIQCPIRTNEDLRITIENPLALEINFQITMRIDDIPVLRVGEQVQQHILKDHYHFFRVNPNNASNIAVKAVSLDNQTGAQLFYSTYLESECKGRSGSLPTANQFCKKSYINNEVFMTALTLENSSDYFFSLRTTNNSNVQIQVLPFKVTELIANKSQAVHINPAIYPYHHLKFKAPHSSSKILKLIVFSPFEKPIPIFMDSNCCSDSFTQFPNEDYNLYQGYGSIEIPLQRSKEYYFTIKNSKDINGSFEVWPRLYDAKELYGKSDPEPGFPLFWILLGLVIFLLLNQIFYYVKGVILARRAQLLGEGPRSQQIEPHPAGEDMSSQNRDVVAIPIIGLKKAKGNKYKKYSGKITEEIICIICQDEAKDITFKPCNHNCACLECARQIYLVSKKCPLCRADITQLKYTPLK